MAYCGLLNDNQISSSFIPNVSSVAVYLNAYSTSTQYISGNGAIDDIGFEEIRSSNGIIGVPGPMIGFKVESNGSYYVSFSVFLVNSAGIAAIPGIFLTLNGNIIAGSTVRQTMSNGTTASVSTSAILFLSANDIIGVKMTSTTIVPSNTLGITATPAGGGIPSQASATINIIKI